MHMYGNHNNDIKQNQKKDFPVCQLATSTCNNGYVIFSRSGLCVMYGHNSSKKQKTKTQTKQKTKQKKKKKKKKKKKTNNDAGSSQ